MTMRSQVRRHLLQCTVHEHCTLIVQYVKFCSVFNKAKTKIHSSHTYVEHVVHIQRG